MAQKTDAKGRPVKFIKVRGRVVPVSADKYRGPVAKPKQKITSSQAMLNLANDKSKYGKKMQSKFEGHKKAYEAGRKKMMWGDVGYAAGMGLGLGSFLLPKKASVAGIAAGAAIGLGSLVYKQKGQGEAIQAVRGGAKTVLKHARKNKTKIVTGV